MQAIMSHGPDVLTKSLPLIDLVSVASETEGFLAADIKAFIERTVHEGAVRSIKSGVADGLTLTQEDFSNARQGFVPSSLRGIKLQSSGVNWSDIGGKILYGYKKRPRIDILFRFKRDEKGFIGNFRVANKIRGSICSMSVTIKIRVSV